MLTKLYIVILTLLLTNCSHKTYAKQPSQQHFLLYLDTDGHYYKGDDSLGRWLTQPFYAKSPSYLTASRLRKAIEVVTEDFSPFNFEITTDSNRYAQSPKNKRIRCLITDFDPEHMPFGIAGVAVGAAGDTARDVNCIVLANVIMPIGDDLGNTISHEVGHTLGLMHQTLTAANGKIKYEYNPGNMKWTPIMGRTMATPMATWNIGPAKDPYTEFNEIRHLRLVLGMKSDNIGGLFKEAQSIDTLGTLSLMNTYDDVDMYVLKPGKYRFTVKSLGNSLLSVQVYNNKRDLVRVVNTEEIIKIESTKKIYIRITTRSNSFVPRECMIGQYKIDFL